jgi:GWxTD domain-containing protein
MNAASSVHNRFPCCFPVKLLRYSLIFIFALTVYLCFPVPADAQQPVQIQQENYDTYRSASGFLQRIVSENNKESFAEATLRYLTVLEYGTFPEDDLELLQEDFRLLQLLNGTELPGGDPGMKPADMAGEMRAFWIRNDPTPGMPANERLIEHVSRVMYAAKHYTSEKDTTGLDERGKIYIRYGEPDVVFDQPLHITRADLFEFVSDIEFALSEASTTHSTGVFEDDGDDVRPSDTMSASGFTASRTTAGRTTNEKAYVTTEELELAIASNPFTTTLKIWIYDRFEPDMENNLIFYLREEEKDVYSLLPSLDDWIPSSLFTPRRSFRGAYAPALALQFIVYRKLMHLDEQIRSAYSRMERDIFYASLPRSDSQIGQLALSHRVRNQQDTFLMRVNSPEERSEELLKLDQIPVEVYQYRMLNEKNEPVFVTFIESWPVSGLLKDLARNVDNMNLEEQLAAGEIGNWYRFEVGTELFRPGMKQVGRLRTFPEVMVDEDRDVPSIILKDIPYIGKGGVQKFYAYLKNQHPESVQGEVISIFPHELRAAGNKTLVQQDHFESSEGLMMSDILFGTGRLDDDDGIRFPFVVKHHRNIRSDDSPVIHFEVYGLSRGDSGFSEFEVEYSIEQENRRRSLFRRGSSTQTGTLHFTSAGSRFAESVEIDNLRLREGNHTLTWKITDLNSGLTTERTIGFTVVD